MSRDSCPCNSIRVLHPRIRSGRTRRTREEPTELRCGSVSKATRRSDSSPRGKAAAFPALLFHLTTEPQRSKAAFRRPGHDVASVTFERRFSTKFSATTAVDNLLSKRLKAGHTRRQGSQRKSERSGDCSEEPGPKGSPEFPCWRRTAPESDSSIGLLGELVGCPSCRAGEHRAVTGQGHAVTGQPAAVELGEFVERNLTRADATPEVGAVERDDFVARTGDSHLEPISPLRASVDHPSAPCSPSPSAPNLSPTTCWLRRNKVHKQYGKFHLGG